MVWFSFSVANSVKQRWKTVWNEPKLYFKSYGKSQSFWYNCSNDFWTSNKQNYCKICKMLSNSKQCVTILMSEGTALDFFSLEIRQGKKRRKGQKWWLANDDREARNIGDQQFIGMGYFRSPNIFAEHFSWAAFHLTKQDLSPIALCIRVSRTFSDHTDNRKLPTIRYVLTVPREMPQLLSLTCICCFPGHSPGTPTLSAAAGLDKEHFILLCPPFAS